METNTEKTVNYRPEQLGLALNTIGAIGSILESEGYDVNPYTFVNDMTVLAGYDYNDLVVNVEYSEIKNDAQASTTGVADSEKVLSVFESYSVEELDKAAEIILAIAEVDLIPQDLRQGIVKAINRTDI